MSDKYSGWPAPSHDRQSSLPGPVPTVPVQDAEEDLEALRKQAADLGVEVEQRWGARRLKREIESARDDNGA